MNRLELFLVMLLLIYGMGSPARADFNGTLIIDFTPIKHQMNSTNQSELPYSYAVSTDLKAKSREFSSMNIRVVRSKSHNEATCWESNVTTLDNITLNLYPGIYKIFTQLEGDRTVLEYNNDSSGYDVSSECYITVPMNYPPNPTGYQFDAPWRIEKSEKIVPIIAVNPRYSMKIRNIFIYDNNNGKKEVIRTSWPLEQQMDSINTPYFYLFKINKDSFINDNGKISITMKFDLAWRFDIEEGPLNIAISQEDLPKILDWYCGDTHLHTNYTDNRVELGHPINAARAANKAMGLDWIAITDHSFDLDSSKWEEQTADCEVHSDNLFRVLQGEEVSCYLPGTGYLLGTHPLYFYNHLLVYGGNFIRGREWEDCFDSVFDYTPKEVIDNVNAQKGVVYIAHPFYDDAFREPFEDYSLNFHGLQIWNCANTDPSLLEKGIKKWVDLLLEGRHIFIEGGTDAHGFSSDFEMLEELERGNLIPRDPLGDFHELAGKVKTYIYAPGYSQTSLPPCEEIINALRYGHSVMTDGPLVVFNVTNEKNETGIIGNEISGNAFALNIQWKSTNEFGKVNHIYVYQGIIGESVESRICDLTPFSLTGSDVCVPSKIPESNVTYFRLAATTDKGFAAFTNPIWVAAPLKLILPAYPIYYPIVFQNRCNYDTLSNHRKMHWARSAAGYY